MNRFAKFWDLYVNSGEFKHYMNWFKTAQLADCDNSYFKKFFKFSEYLSISFSDTHSLSLMSLAEQAYNFMQSEGLAESEAAEVITQDYSFGTKRRDLPTFLKSKTEKPSRRIEKASLNQRQLKHLN